MNKIFTTIVLLVCTTLAFSQSLIVKYTYDTAGNRTKREMKEILLKSASSVVEDEPLTTDEVQANAIESEKEAAIEDIWNKRTVTFYPNPTRGELKVNISGGDDNVNYTYELFDASGTKIMNGRISQMGENPVPMDECKPGIYFLVLVCGDDRNTYKIIRE